MFKLNILIFCRNAKNFLSSEKQEDKDKEKMD